MITAVSLQNNQGGSLCDWTDNNLITFFTINKFCTRNLQSISYHGTIIRTGITCKKIPCYMRDSACRWFIVKKAKIF